MKIIKLPQLIDPHVHFRTPGLEEKEGWATGSRAALAGGISVVLEMPNTKPPTVSQKRLKEKIDIIKKDALVNFGLHFAAAENNLSEIKKVKNKVASIKVFLNQSTGHLKIKDDKILLKIFAASPLISVHAEEEMIEKAVWLTKKAGNRLYFCHVYSADCLEYLKKYKKKLPLYLEVTPHHLFLNQSDHGRPFNRVLPPLQKKSDQKALWQGVIDGTIDTIGSDHAPHTSEEKKSANPPAGLPGLETVLPLMLSEVSRKNLSLERLVELMSKNPARIFRLPVRTDTYTEVDLEKKKIVSHKNLQTKVKWSPYAGWKLTGWPVRTYVNGRLVYDHGKFIGQYKGKEIKYGKI